MIILAFNYLKEDFIVALMLTQRLFIYLRLWRNIEDVNLIKEIGMLKILLHLFSMTNNYVLVIICLLINAKKLEKKILNVN